MRSWLRFIGPSYFDGDSRADQRAVSDHLIAKADHWTLDERTPPRCTRAARGTWAKRSAFCEMAAAALGFAHGELVHGKPAFR
jgi:hypothetical protein